MTDKLNALINRLQAENKEWKTLVEVGELQYRKQKAEIEDLEKKLKKQIQSKRLVRKQAKAEAYKECIEKVSNIITEIYNKHIFGSNDLIDEEKDAVINYSDDITYRLNNLLKELVGEKDDTFS